MLLRDKETNIVTEPNHLVVRYIASRLKTLDWTPIDLANNSTISQGEISKILGGKRTGLKAKIFYILYSAFGDTCTDATKVVYPELSFELNTYVPKDRNSFGNFMQQFEESKNSIEEIAFKTGIDENRLKNLYYRKAALEAYELLLIEKAVGKDEGELFEEYFGSKTK